VNIPNNVPGTTTSGAPPSLAPAAKTGPATPSGADAPASTLTPPTPSAARAQPTRDVPRLYKLLFADRSAAFAALFLLLAAGCALLGPQLLGATAQRQDLSLSRLAPLSFDQMGWLGLLGTDPLGRSVVARVIVAAGTTFTIAVPTVLVSMIIGSTVGLWAGYHGGRRESFAMRFADVIMSFPSLLLAVVVLFIFGPSVLNLIIVLSIARIPIYLRTARAEAASLRGRGFVDAARIFGTSSGAIIVRHIFPIVLPTLLTIATLDFSTVTLAESALSFLGLGIQPPDVSWGLMVSDGRVYLQTAWWLSFFPGLAIVLTTASATILSSWARLATDPDQRWRLTTPVLRPRQIRKSKRP
jgi:peptide/nickel transport system permease protein